jgi:hypothetical protein
MAGPLQGDDFYVWPNIVNTMIQHAQRFHGGRKVHGACAREEGRWWYRGQARSVRQKWPGVAGDLEGL